MTRNPTNALRSAFQAAIDQADPEAAVARHMTALSRNANGRVIVIAAGKAAPAMLRGAMAQLGPDIEALCVTHKENQDRIENIPFFNSGHPIPDDVGLEATQKIAEVLADTTADDHVIALISGGASALLPAPAQGISLADKQALNAALLASGLDIVEMNMIRQQVSTLKGGGLLRQAAPAPVSAYILSDVVGDDLRAIASGPTVAPLGTKTSARDRLQQVGAWDTLPTSIQTHLQGPDVNDDLPNASNTLVGSNPQSVEAAAAHLRSEFNVIAIDEPLVGDVGTAAEKIIAALDNHLPVSAATAIVWGGETTVQLRGDGRGGRNQELALLVARHLNARNPSQTVHFLSGGTDGRDGPTDAAGAIVDTGTWPRITDADLDPAALLANNDSYAALQASGDLLITGATGTNVADIQILMIQP
ncbi:MAG: glycerate kinase type-2 family protein [Paracoccaceae bacterium]